MSIKQTLKLLFLVMVLPVNAQECMLRRIIEHVENPDYRPTHILYAYQMQVQLDTNLTLFRRKYGKKPEMDLAEKVLVDLKHKTLQVKLKQNCAWSDGTQITADQLKKGIELVFEQEDRIALPFNHFFKNAQAVFDGQKGVDKLGVRVVDDFTLEFDLVTSPDLLIHALSFPAFTPAPLHLMARHGYIWPTKSIVRVSSGAYQAIIDEDGHIIMKPNQYVCPSIKADFDYVNITRGNNWFLWGKYIVTNQIDVAHEVKPNQASMIIKNQPEDVNLSLDSRSGDTIAYLAINPNNSLLKNPEVRQAMRLAVDYNLVKNISTLRDVDTSPYIGLSVAYPGYAQIKDKQMLAKYEQRVIRAKALMSKAGYGPDKRLKLVMPGKKIARSKNIETAFISMMKQIYIDISIDRNLSLKEYWQLLADEDYQIIITTWQADFPDPSSFMEGILQTIKLPRQLTRDLAKRLNDSYKIYDDEKRLDILANIEADILSQNYVIPLYLFKSNYLLRPGFKVLDEPLMSARNIAKDGCD